MKTTQPQTKTFWVLVTDGTARLVFYSEDAAKKYVKNDIYGDTTTIQKVYGQTQFVEVAN